MFFVFVGGDKGREKARKFTDDFLLKHPDTVPVRFTDDTFDALLFDTHLEGVGLFGNVSLAMLLGTLESDEAREAILDRLARMKESPNVFVVVEDELSAATIRTLEKYAEKTEVFKVPPNRDERPKLFSLTDALGARDRKALWVLYQKALRQGVSAEEIHGMLFWQVKTLLLVAQKSTEGLKPFVISKARSFVKNYSLPELKNLSGSLVNLYHNSRAGGPDLPIALEQFVLNL